MLFLNIHPMKKDLLLGISAMSGLAAITGCSPAQKEETVDLKRPNVIFIYSDDLGIGDLSCYGATKISTPNIDSLASQGLQFTNAYATSATSTPSRYGMLTGTYPWRKENTGIAPGNSELIIDTTCVTLADVFHDAGYRTAAVGKWHLGLALREERISTDSSSRTRKASASTMSSSSLPP